MCLGVAMTRWEVPKAHGGHQGREAPVKVMPVHSIVEVTTGIIFFLLVIICIRQAQFFYVLPLPFIFARFVHQGMLQLLECL